MREKKILLSAALLSLLTACSVHPLPEDVSPDDTQAIVKKINCEAKEAVKDILLKVLFEMQDDPQSMKVYRLVRYENHEFGDAELKLLSTLAFKRLEPWLNSGIGMTFLLTTTEIDNGSATAKIGLPFTDGALNLSLNAGKDLTRKNVRTVKMTRSWSGVAILDCSDTTVTRKNLLYPITGRVGIAEVLTTYFNLWDRIEGKVDAKSLETFSDQLVFTTKLSGGLNPTYELKAAPDKLHLASAGVNLSGSREDMHDLVVTLTPPEKPKPKTDDLEVKLADNVILTVKVPKGKYVGAKPPLKPVQPQKPATRSINRDPTLEQRERLLKEMDRILNLDALKNLD